MEAWVEIIRGDGSAERHRLEEDQVTIGRSPTAGIPLVSAEELQPEHVLLAPRPDGCWIAVAEGAEPLPMVHGEPLRQGMVPWGTELVLGPITLKVSDKPPPTRKEKQKSQVSAPVLILTLVMLPLLGWLLLSGPSEELPLDPDTPPPELFADVDASCPGKGSALHTARRSAEAASHKSERYPFDAQDGVEAVGLYAEAQGCYAKAGRKADAKRMKRLRAALAEQIEEDYRTHKLRLERALEHGHFEDALVETRSLNELLAHTDGPYEQWLSVLERRLQLRMDNKLGGV